MNVQSQNVFDAALALPEAERAWLAERLLETLSAESDEFTDEEMLVELKARQAEVADGTAQGVPWSELKEEP
jgi:putative addiction module component (TIGR02574 family)